VYRLAQRGEKGCKTVLDVAPADLSLLSGEALRAKML
jgi:diaminopimelate dehydrogenase